MADKERNPTLNLDPNTPVEVEFVFETPLGPKASNHEGAPDYYLTTVKVDGDEYTLFLNDDVWFSVERLLGKNVKGKTVVLERVKRGQEPAHVVAYLSDAPKDPAKTTQTQAASADKYPHMAYTGARMMICHQMARKLASVASEGVEVSADVLYEQTMLDARTMYIDSKNARPSDGAVQTFLKLMGCKNTSPANDGHDGAREPEEPPSERGSADYDDLPF